MSLENHPNFHAVKFATDITVSYYASLRDKGINRSQKIDKTIQRWIIDFVSNIEDEIDKDVGV